MSDSPAEDSEEEQSRLFAFQTLLDASRFATQPTVDRAHLRDLCRDGIPNHPLHLRPLSYSLLLGILPLDKRAWRNASRNQRLHYYTLVKTHLEPLESLPQPATPLRPNDKLLVTISQDISSTIPRFPFLEGRTKVSNTSPLAPPKPADLDPAFKEDIKEDGYLEGYTSSSSEEEESELAARSKDLPARATSGPGPIKRLLCRRAAFTRLDAIATADHRNQYAKATEAKKENGNTAEGSRPASPEAVLSPRITLSSEPSQPSGFSQSSSASRDSRFETPQLSLSLPVGRNDADSEQSSPITLLSPRPIPTPGSASLSNFVSGSLLQPDTHAEVVFRLLYIFSQSNTQWAYHQELVDLIITLYVVYLELDQKSLYISPRRRGKQSLNSTPRAVALSKWAEEQTYWAFCALIREYESTVIGLGPHSHPKSDINHALLGLGKRLKWADEPLWSILCENDLDPSSPVFASRWLSVLLTRDLPIQYLLPMWDYLLSSDSTLETPLGRLDALLDASTALLIVSRRALLGPAARIAPGNTQPSGSRGLHRTSGLWDNDDAPETLNSSFDPARQLEFLRSLPMREICEPQQLLKITNEIRQARTEDPRLNLEYDEPSRNQLWLPSLEPGTRLLRQYADVEKLGSWTQSSSVWATSAFHKVAGQLAASSSPDTNTTTAPAQNTPSKLWACLRSWAPVSASGQQVESPAAGPPESAPAYIDPSDSLHHTPPSAATHRQPIKSRERSDSTTSGFSVSSIQERLASLTSTFASPDTPPSKRSSLQSVSFGPKPLLLSGSARRASGSSQGRPASKLRRDSGGPEGYGCSPISSPARIASPPNGASGVAGALSPPAIINSGELNEGATTPAGLYRISSRQGAALGAAAATAGAGLERPKRASTPLGPRKPGAIPRGGDEAQPQ